MRFDVVEQYIDNTQGPDELQNLGIFLFAREYFPDRFRQEFAMIHYEIMVLLFQLLDPRKNYSFERMRYLLVHREAAKTTLSTFLLPIILIYFKGITIYVRKSMLDWDPTQGISITDYMNKYENDEAIGITINEQFIVICSETKDQAERFANNIKVEIESRQDLSEVFGEKDPRVIEATQEERRRTANAWRVNCFITSDDTILLGLGAGQRIRGRNERGWRPTIIIVDDMYSLQNIKTEATRNNLSYWLHAEVINSLDINTGKIMWLGTLLHPDTVIKDLRLDDDWKGIERPLIALDELQEVIHKCTVNGKFELPSEEQCAQWQANIRTLSWPERHNLYTILKRYFKHLTKGKLNIFYQEFMNEPVAPENQVINPESFYKTDLEFYKKQNHQMVEFTYEGVKWVGQCNLYVGIDPASSQSEKADETVISVVGFARCYPHYVGRDIESSESSLPRGRIFPIIAHMEGGKYAIHEYENMPGITESCFKIDRRYILESIKIELAGQQEQIIREIQKSFQDGIRDRHGMLTHKPSSTPVWGELVTSHEGSKAERMLSILVPIVQKYKVIICFNSVLINKMYDQLLMSTVMNVHDDWPDSVSIGFRNVRVPDIDDRFASKIVPDEGQVEELSSWEKCVRIYGNNAWYHYNNGYY